MSRAATLLRNPSYDSVATQGPEMPGQPARVWMIVISAIVLIHFAAVIVRVLASPSGPWAMNEGSGFSTPPQFAFDLDKAFGSYLQVVKLNYNYHYPGNRPARPAAKLVAVDADQSGQERTRMTIPEPGANLWVRHRQGILVRWLADDQPVAPPIGEMISAPNTAPPSTLIWELSENRQLQLRSVPAHLVPRDRPVFRPSDWSRLLARSFSRHAARSLGASDFHIVRHTFEAIPPSVLFISNMPTTGFEKLVSDFGASPP